MFTKKHTLLALSLSLMGSNVLAQGVYSDRVYTERPGWYGSVDAGQLFADGDVDINSAAVDIGDDSSDADLFGVALGYDLGHGKPWRFEAEYRYRDADADDIDRSFNGNRFDVDGDLSAESLMFNALYDFPTASKVRPYAKAGLGYARSSVDNARVQTRNGGSVINTASFSDESDSNFAWSVGGGVDIPFSPSAAFNVEYQYIDLGDVETRNNAGGRAEFDNVGHEVSIGVNFKF